MGLLTAPLGAWDEGGGASEVYAEWVGARARVALLEAHAHCAAFASASQHAAASDLVRGAQVRFFYLVLLCG